MHLITFILNFLLIITLLPNGLIENVVGMTDEELEKALKKLDYRIQLLEGFYNKTNNDINELKTKINPKDNTAELSKELKNVEKDVADMKIAITKIANSTTNHTNNNTTNTTSACPEGWQLYKDEKCFQVFDKKLGLQTYEDAEKACRQQGSGVTLITIHSSDEQKFITDFLFKQSKVVDNVWAGAKNLSDTFHWTADGDNSDLSYTNWADGSPKHKPEYCIQLLSEESTAGKWSDVTCAKKAVVACQRAQTVSMQSLQAKLLKLEKTGGLPLGFTYVQLPQTQSPKELWPTMQWQDVSETYAGVFFRVEGSGSGTFGSVQNETAPRVTQIETKKAQDNNGLETGTQKLKVNSTSDWFYTGDMSTQFYNHYYLRLGLSGGEVRPRNMAVRVWKRSG